MTTSQRVHATSDALPRPDAVAWAEATRADEGEPTGEPPVEPPPDQANPRLENLYG